MMKRIFQKRKFVEVTERDTAESSIATTKRIRQERAKALPDCSIHKGKIDQFFYTLRPEASTSRLQFDMRFAQPSIIKIVHTPRPVNKIVYETFLI